MSRKKLLGKQVSRETIRKILAVGHEFDVNKNGLYDARLGAVNVWCSPEDKPSCWDTEIIKGGLDYPRDYVGGLYWDWTSDDQADLFIEVDAFELVRSKKKLSDEEWESIIQWVEDKVNGLLRLASLQAKVVGTKCPLCDFVLPTDRLSNELLKHMTIHGRIQDITLGETTVVRINGKNYPLQTVESFED